MQSVMLRPPNSLPAESSTADTNSSHLLRETRDDLPVSMIMPVFCLTAYGDREDECGGYMYSSNCSAHASGGISDKKRFPAAV